MQQVIKNCALCGKPLGGPYVVEKEDRAPEVSHFACVMESARETREKLEYKLSQLRK